MDRLSLLQSAVYWLVPTKVYGKTPAVARRNRGFRLISVTHEVVPTRLGLFLGFPHFREDYEGAARRWNTIRLGEPVTDERMVDWLERIWLASIGAEASPDLGPMPRRDRVI